MACVLVCDIAMSTRCVAMMAALLTAGLLSASTAEAQEVSGDPTWAQAAVELDLDSPLAPALPILPAPSRRLQPRQPRWFLPVHGVTLGLQALDTHSTLRALDAGAREINPLSEPFVHRRPAFVALKMGVAAGLIWGTGSMAKTHPIRALLVASAVNSAFAVLVARNYEVARTSPR
jgi:hypothetical protein